MPQAALIHQVPCCSLLTLELSPSLRSPQLFLNREWGTRIADVPHVLCHLVIALRLFAQLGEVDVGDAALARHLLSMLVMICQAVQRDPTAFLEVIDDNLCSCTQSGYPLQGYL